MTINRKIYILNSIIWLVALAVVLALLWIAGAWLIHKWNFPGLP